MPPAAYAPLGLAPATPAAPPASPPDLGECVRAQTRQALSGLQVEASAVNASPGRARQTVIDAVTPERARSVGSALYADGNDCAADRLALEDRGSVETTGGSATWFAYSQPGTNAATRYHLVIRNRHLVSVVWLATPAPVPAAALRDFETAAAKAME